MSVMRGLYLFNQQMIDITDQNNSFSVVSVMSVMSVVSVVRGLYLIDRSLKIVDTSNKNTTVNIIAIKCMIC